APQLVAGEHRVRVRVDEARQQRAAVQVDDLGARAVAARGALRVGLGLDGGDAARADAHGGTTGHEPMAVEDRAMAEKEFCAGCHPGLPSVASCPVLKQLTKMLSMPWTRSVDVRLPLDRRG